MGTMTIRCDETGKRAAAEVTDHYGFDLSSVIRTFWKQMARTRRIPLELGNREPNAKNMHNIREADEIVAAGGTGESYDTARSLLDAARA